MHNWEAEQTVFLKVTIDIDLAKSESTFSGYYGIDGGKDWKLVVTFFTEE